MTRVSTIYINKLCEILREKEKRAFLHDSCDTVPVHIIVSLYNNNNNNDKEFI